MQRKGIRSTQLAAGLANQGRGLQPWTPGLLPGRRPAGPTAIAADIATRNLQEVSEARQQSVAHQIP